jgi:hypothetical protein
MGPRMQAQTAIEELASLELHNSDIVLTYLGGSLWLHDRTHYLNRSSLCQGGGGNEARGYEEDERKESSEHFGSLTWKKGCNGLKGCGKNEGRSQIEIEIR